MNPNIKYGQRIKNSFNLNGEKMINIKNIDLDEIELNKDLNYLFHELLKFSTEEWIYFEFPFNTQSLRIESILDKIDKII